MTDEFDSVQYAPGYDARDVRSVAERVASLPTALPLPMATIRTLGFMPGGKWAVFGRREIAAALKAAGWRNIGGDTWSPPRPDAEPA